MLHLNLTAPFGTTISNLACQSQLQVFMLGMLVSVPTPCLFTHIINQQSLISSFTPLDQYVNTWVFKGQGIMD